MNRIFVSLQENLLEPVWLSNVEPFVNKLLEKLGYDSQEISLLFCNDEYIRELNNTYRNIDSATDVLSFESGDEYEDEEGRWFCAGDIIISLDTLPLNAEYFNEDTNSELKRLLLHGLLHLNGFDHADEHIQKDIEPTCEMLILQEKILNELKDEKII